MGLVLGGRDLACNRSGYASVCSLLLAIRDGHGAVISNIVMAKQVSNPFWTHPNIIKYMDLHGVNLWSRGGFKSGPLTPTAVPDHMLEKYTNQNKKERYLAFDETSLEDLNLSAL